MNCFPIIILEGFGNFNLAPQDERVSITLANLYNTPTSTDITNEKQNSIF